MGKGSRRSKSMSDQRGSQKEDKQEQNVSVSDRVGRVMISTLAMSASSIPLSTMLLALLSSRSKRMETAALHKHERRGTGSKLTFEFLGSNCFLFGLPVNYV